jgi:hypothetical protein
VSEDKTEADTEELLYPDPVVELYMKDVDRSLIRSQLRKTPTERLQDLIAMAEFYEEGRRARAKAQDGK